MTACPGDNGQPATAAVAAAATASRIPPPSELQPLLNALNSGGDYSGGVHTRAARGSERRRRRKGAMEIGGDGSGNVDVDGDGEGQPPRSLYAAIATAAAQDSANARDSYSSGTISNSDTGLDDEDDHDYERQAEPASERQGLIPATGDREGPGDNLDDRGSDTAEEEEEEEEVFMMDADRGRFLALFATIMTAFFVALFDSTVLASSHPVITSEFGASALASWTSTAYALGSTVLPPAAARASDALGRRLPFAAGVAAFSLATAACALAPSMLAFVLARAVAGLGAGCMMAMGGAMMGDMIPNERRGTWQSWVNVVTGLAMASGAALGGVVADTLGWRWEFGVQLVPLAACFAAAVCLIPADLGRQKPQRPRQKYSTAAASGRTAEVDGGGGGVGPTSSTRTSFASAMRSFDYAGSFLLTTSATFFVLAMSVGGNILPWSHPLTIASLAIAAVASPLCVWVESRAEKPVMPLELLRSAPRANLIFANFIGNFLVHAIMFNAPIFFQAVLLRSPTASGLYLSFPAVASTASGWVASRLVARTRRTRWAVVGGAAGFLLGTLAMSLMSSPPFVFSSSSSSHQPQPEASAMNSSTSTSSNNTALALLYLLSLLPASLGQGCQFSATLLAVLHALPARSRAVAATTLQLWRQLGAVLGVACTSFVLQAALPACLDASLPPALPGRAELAARVRASVAAVARIEDPAVRSQVAAAYGAALRITFLACAALALLALLLVLPVRLPRLDEGRGRGTATATAAATATERRGRI